jgi:TRAP-type C4-dicarboxylate transport system substrate-binding protein
MSFRRTLISLAAVTLTSLAVAFPLNASAQTVLKAADVHPPGYPNVVAMENLGKKLEAATNGKYKLQMFPGGVLGSEKEMIEQTQIGAIRSPASPWARWARWCPRSTCSTCRSCSATNPTCAP